MFEVVLIGHGEISKGFLNAVEMIIGEQEKLNTLVLNPEDTFEAYLDRLTNLTKDVEDVLFLADLQGGTPANAATYLVKKNGYQCIAGINLPLLLEILVSRKAGVGIDECVSLAMSLVNDSIHLINQ